MADPIGSVGCLRLAFGLRDADHRGVPVAGLLPRGAACAAHLLDALSGGVVRLVVRTPGPHPGREGHPAGLCSCRHRTDGCHRVGARRIPGPVYPSTPCLDRRIHRRGCGGRGGLAATATRHPRCNLPGDGHRDELVCCHGVAGIAAGAPCRPRVRGSGVWVVSPGDGGGGGAAGMAGTLEPLVPDRAAVRDCRHHDPGRQPAACHGACRARTAAAAGRRGPLGRSEPHA